MTVTDRTAYDAALAEIHGQNPGRMYTLAEVKRLIYSLDGEEPRRVGFADRERLAHSAYAIFHPSEDQRSMTHDFRGGFHLGFLDGLASAKSGGAT